MIHGSNYINSAPPTGPVRLWDCGVEWAGLEPVKGHFDWSKLDQIVSSLQGRDIMLVLGHPPKWAALGKTGGQALWLPEGANRPPRSYSAWNRYVSEVVQRYKGRISSYQIWNEPADRRFYSGDYDILATLVTKARATIKSIDPHAKVVSPPLQPRRQAGWDARGAAIYRSLKDARFPFDVWSAHIYPQIGEGTNAWVRDVRMVQNRIGDTTKPLWITETNFNVAGPGNPYRVSDQKAILDTIRSRCYTLDIPRVYWYGYGHSHPSLFAINIV